MLALLKKDLFVIKKTGAIYLALVIFYFLYGVVNGEFSMLQMFLMLFVLMLPVTAMGYDERVNWDKYGMCLPVPRRAMVTSKFALIGLLLVVSVLLTEMITVGYLIIAGRPVTGEMLAQPVLSACAGLLVCDLAMPVMFRVGTEKGRFVMIGLIWAVALIPVVLLRLGVDVYGALERVIACLSGGAAMAVVCAAALVLTAASILISIAVYDRKELA